FQAEDGIRDLYVTGVQTCALPIYVAGQDHQFRTALLDQRLDACLLLAAGIWGDGQVMKGNVPDVARGERGGRMVGCDADDLDRRSEERRVGKECMSRWARHHERKR